MKLKITARIKVKARESYYSSGWIDPSGKFYRLNNLGMDSWVEHGDWAREYVKNHPEEFPNLQSDYFNNHSVYVKYDIWANPLLEKRWIRIGSYAKNTSFAHCYFWNQSILEHIQKVLLENPDLKKREIDLDITDQFNIEIETDKFLSMNKYTEILRDPNLQKGRKKFKARRDEYET
jgi:hypothetical protein